jgi:hypothetical protein
LAIFAAFVPHLPAFSGLVADADGFLAPSCRENATARKDLVKRLLEFPTAELFRRGEAP